MRAAEPGRVVAVGTPRGFEGYGNLVKVSLGGGWVALYAHLAGWRVRVGEQVSAGQRLGTAGCTGWCTGTHLHFELRHLGLAVEPAALPSEEGRAQLGELLLQVGRHLLDRRLPDEPPQLLLEPVALAAVGAAVQVQLGLGPLGVGELPVEVGLQELLALVTGIDFRSNAIRRSPPSRPPALVSGYAAHDAGGT